MAGREDSVAGGGGDGSGRKRRGTDEQDDGHTDNDYDDRPRNWRALYIYDVYI
jgi:hypothetical protein